MDEDLLKLLISLNRQSGNPVVSDSMSSLERMFAKPQMFIPTKPSVDWQDQHNIRTRPSSQEALQQILRGLQDNQIPSQYTGWRGKMRM